MASGSGSTAEAFAGAIHDEIIDAEIGLVISDKEDAGIFGRVSRWNSEYGFDVKTRLINEELYPKGRQPRGQTLAEAEEICRAVDEAGVALVALMGYMRVVVEEGDLMREYGWLSEYEEHDTGTRGIYLARMLNTHPGILPATADTYGIYTQRKVLELGLTQTAHTVHAVSAGIDEGPVFAENLVPVYPDEDTDKGLFARVQRIEKAHLPIDIDRFLKEQEKYNANS